MAEETDRIFDTQDLTLTWAALGGGGPFDSTGAVKSGGKSYSWSLAHGACTVQLPTREVIHVRVRGRTHDVPLLRRGQSQDATISVEGLFSDMTDTAAATFADILLGLIGYPKAGSYVAANWDSSLDSAAGANDAPLECYGLKVAWAQEGDATNTAFMAFNYVYASGAPTLDAGGNPNAFSATFAAPCRAGSTHFYLG